MKLYYDDLGCPPRRPYAFTAYRLLRTVVWLPGRFSMWLLRKTDGLCPGCGADLTLHPGMDICLEYEDRKQHRRLMTHPTK